MELLYILFLYQSFSTLLVRTSSRESQLPASYSSINSRPEIITNCSPNILVANLNASLSDKESTLDSEVSFSTN